MKRILRILVVVTLPLVKVGAWDYSVTVDDVSAFSHINTSDWTTVQANKATLAASTPLSDSVFFQTQLAFFFLDTNNNPYSVPNLPDPSMTLDFLSLSAQGTQDLGSDGLATWFAGRDFKTDLTGWVFNSRMDGAALFWQKGPQRVGAESYYTGLVSNQNSSVLISNDDYTDGSTYYSWGDPFLYQFAPKRIITALDYTYSELFARQDLDVQALGQLDLRSSKAVHSFYTSARLSGPVSTLRYQFFTTISTLVGTSSTAWSVLGGFRTIWNLNDFGWTLVGDGLLSHRLTPADGDGFVPISEKGPSTTLSTLSLWNVAELGLDASFHPLYRATLGLKVDSLFQTTSQNQNQDADASNGVYQAFVQNLDKNNSQPYLGSEAAFYGSWTPTSEWTFAFSASGFVPSSQAFTDSHPIWLIAATASLQI